MSTILIFKYAELSSSIALAVLFSNSSPVTSANIYGVQQSQEMLERGFWVFLVLYLLASYTQRAFRRR